LLALDVAAGAHVLLALDGAAGTEVLTLDGHVDGGGGWLGFEGGGLVVGWKVWFEVKAVSGCGCDCVMGKKRGGEGISRRYLYSDGRRKRWESGRGGCMVERGRMSAVCL
jgi:hypothetical protein